MPDEATTKCIWSSIATFLGGGFVGTWLGHLLAIGRDSRNRKHTEKAARDARIRDFKGFMSSFRSWVERETVGNLGEEFNDRVHPFREQAERIRQDIAQDKRTQFDERVTALCRLTASELTEYIFEGNNNVNYVGRNKLCTAIDRLVETLD